MVNIWIQIIVKSIKTTSGGWGLAVKLSQFPNWNQDLDPIHYAMPIWILDFRLVSWTNSQIYRICLPFYEPFLIFMTTIINQELKKHMKNSNCLLIFPVLGSCIHSHSCKNPHIITSLNPQPHMQKCTDADFWPRKFLWEPISDFFGILGVFID